MKLLRTVMLGILVAGLLGTLGGCESVDQFTQKDLEEFTTLTVYYGDPGPSPNPCNDNLPQIDGVATDAEWALAEPAFVKMSPEWGNGGTEYFLEVRALWTDESRVGGQDRIYFLLRYPDDAFNAQPDDLIYGHVNDLGEVVSSPPPPNPAPGQCDTLVTSTSAWSRINQGGVEDQVVMLITEVENDQATTGLVPANQILLGEIGDEAAENLYLKDHVEEADVWVWRAGRTDRHPIYQFASWDDIDDETDLPDYQFNQFQNRCGFMEDLWINSGSSLLSDAGQKPFAKNFIVLGPGEEPPPGQNGDPVPIRLTQCPEGGRDEEEEGVVRNAGIPPDLALWMYTSTRFVCTSKLACSRIGTPRVWGTRLREGEYDRLQGWGLQRPEGSSRDIRARGTLAVSQDKGFAVQVLELMRDMNTQQSDDLVIDSLRHYRMVIGIWNNSGTVGCGSFEIRLQFQERTPDPGERSRC